MPTLVTFPSESNRRPEEEQRLRLGAGLFAVLNQPLVARAFGERQGLGAARVPIGSPRGLNFPRVVGVFERPLTSGRRRLAWKGATLRSARFRWLLVHERHGAFQHLVVSSANSRDRWCHRDVGLDADEMVGPAPVVPRDPHPGE
jgi:hypothetical protein